ncbi:MAG: hypothetical protein ACO1QB_00530 [Verrucomicrobiales bacterium]
MKINLLSRAFLCLTVALVSSVAVRAQVPPAEQLLPDNVIAVGTIRDWTKANTYLSQTPTSMFWNDSSMKPFRDKFMTKFNAEIVQPLERELGVKLADYKEILQGQITFAVAPPADADGTFGVLLLLDSKDKSDILKTRLSEIQKKWRDNGKQIKTEKIRDIEFSTLIISKKDVKNLMEKAFPNLASGSAEESETDESATEDPKDQVQVHIGQSKSLLLIGNQPALIEKVVARQSGGLVPPLADQPSFQKNYPALFRDGVGYGWLRIGPIYEMALKAAASSSDPNAEPNPMAAFKPEKILPALGLKALDSIGMTFSGNNEGDRATLFVAIPEAQREGIFKAFTLEKKDSTPPAFVPADAVKFQRVRLDLQKTWANLQQMLNNIDPSFAAFLQFGISTLNTVGKEKDPNFDFAQTIIGNLGDDIITYEKAPKAATAEAIAAPPSITLISSPQATQLLDAVRGLTALMPQGGAEGLKESEFLGRKIYTYTTPTPEDLPEDVEVPAAMPSFHFAASGGYVAIAVDRPMLEEYLRGSESGAKPLRSVAGFGENTQTVNGANSGFFGYENQTETIRYIFDLLKKDKTALQKMFEPAAMPSEDDAESDSFFAWFDTSLLPDFNAVSKYFGPAAYSVNSTAEGYKIEAFSPRPAALK